MNKKRWIALIISLFALGVGGAVASEFIASSTKRTDNSPVPAAQVVEPATPQTVPRLRLIGNGDLLPHDSINQQAKTATGYDYKPFFSEINKFYQGADVRFCNQEVTTAPSFGIAGYPSFNAPTQFASDIAAVGCNVINVANNHINDKGQQGIDETLGVWDSLKPLAIAGANRSVEEQATPRYFEVKGVKFAFVAYSEISNIRNFTAYGLNTLRDDLVSAQLKEARAQADIVLVSVHWGTEYSPAINAVQERWAKTFADLGVDVVLGTGPHVLQPVKRLPRAGGGETIAYFSLGNLLSTQLDIESLIGGFAVIDIDTTTKKVTSANFLPTYMHYEWTADQKAREDLLSRRNLKIYPLDIAAEPLKRSQNNTSVEAQTKRVTDLLNSQTTIKILKSTEF